MSISQDILGFEDLRTKKVKVSQWKTTLTIRELGLQESMQAYGSLQPTEDGEVTLAYGDIAKIVAFGVIDPATGERAFSDADIPKLARKNHKALMMLYTEITGLSGTVEDEVKN